MPTARSQLAVGVINGSLFVIGGNNNLTFVSTVDVYDAASNAWTTLSNSLATVRHQSSVAVANKALYAIGGRSDLEGSKFLTTNEQFFPAPCWAQRVAGGAPR